MSRLAEWRRRARTISARVTLLEDEAIGMQTEIRELYTFHSALLEKLDAYRERLELTEQQAQAVHEQLEGVAQMGEATAGRLESTRRRYDQELERHAGEIYDLGSTLRRLDEQVTDALRRTL